MSTSTSTSSFTVTNARYLSSKVAGDLRQLQRLYGVPSDAMIADYLVELTVLLAGRYLQSVEYGFQRNGKWILTLSYSVSPDGTLVTDSRSGGVYPSADVDGATFYSYLCHTRAWLDLSEAQRDAIEDIIPIKRSPSDAPGAEGGYWVESDRSYASGGVGVVRRTYRPW
jgi:hypothetical protein